jgi:hypothetical protein
MVEKTLNLVYESWNGDEYVVNGMSSFNQFLFFDSINFFETHIIEPTGRKDHTERKLSLKVCNLDDVKKNPHEKFFCIVGSAFLSSKLIMENRWNFFLLESTLEAIRQNQNLILIITMEHEPACDAEIKCTKELLRENGISTNQFYYITNNSLSDFLSQKYGINTKKINFIDYSSTFALTEVKDVNFVENKTGKFFMSRNKTAKPHRLNLLFHLMINNLLQDINYSKLFTYPADDVMPYYLSFGGGEISEKVDLIKSFNTTIKEDDYENGKGYYDYNNYGFRGFHQEGQSTLHYPELKESYENSYVNIISESAYESQNFYPGVIHTTEKSFRPFFYYQIPLILATPNHIKQLKKKYDFDFFDDVIDHSYDSELNDKKRFLMFIDEIKRINNNKEQIKEFYKKNRERFESNRKKLLEIALDKTEDFNLFWDLI